MIGLDTNVLVRYFAQDDRRQSRVASRLIESLTIEEPGFVSVVTLAETVWVLQDVYDRGHAEVAAIVESLLQTEAIEVQMSELVSQALRRFRSSRADLADHLIERLGASADCSSTVTFDKIAARDAGLRLLTETDK